MRRPRIAAVLIGLTLGSAAGAMACQPCDGGVCGDSFRIFLEEPGGGPLQDGSYVLDIVLDDGTSYEITCTIANGAVDASCPGPVVTAPHFDSPDNPVEGIWVTFPDASMNQEQLPSHIDIRVDHDGAVLVDEHLEVETEEVDPVCAPGCVKGQETFAFGR